MTEKALMGTVRGRVQQVGFRQSCRRVARSLDLVGWVRNTIDGDVQFFAQGGSAEVDLLVDWLWTGPPMAQVLAVESESTAANPNLTDFFIQPNPSSLEENR